MFCPECRSELPDDAKYCIKCGYDFTKIKTPPVKKHDQDSLGGVGTSIQQEHDIDSFGVGSLFANRYEIMSEGHKGGMGAVYKCKDTKLNEIVALKVINPSLISSTQALSRFRQEVSISRKLHHPNIVRVYNLEEWDGKEYFTMEWVEGVTLREIITRRKPENRPFSIEEAYRVISQLSDALQHAHQFTIHRDIKPENILIPEGKELNVKLTDFGIAKMLSPSQFTSTSMQMGTPYYMAPEQKVDAANIDKRADIYALGVVLFELLTLENTIGLEMPSEINKNLPSIIDAIIKKAVATKPNDRYADATDLSAALKKITDRFSEQAERSSKEAEEQRKREEERRQKETEEKQQKEADQKKKEEAERARQAEVKAEAEQKKIEKQTREENRKVNITVTETKRVQRTWPMRKVFSIAVLLLIALTIILISKKKMFPIVGQSSNEPGLAEVGEVVISQYDFDKELRALPEYAQEMFKGKEGKEKFLDELIKKEILYQEAVKKGFDKTPDFQKKMEEFKRGLDKTPDFQKKVEEFKKLTVIQELLEKEIMAKSKASDQEVSEYYNKHKDELTSTAQIKASHILVKTLEEANKIESRLKKGEKFEEIAKKESIDKGSAKNGGDLGFFSKGQMVPEFEKVAAGLKNGEISSPVKSNFGYHIIKVTDRRTGPVIEFEKIKVLITQKLSGEKQKEAFDKYIEAAKKNYNITINKDRL